MSEHNVKTVAQLLKERRDAGLTAADITKDYASAAPVDERIAAWTAIASHPFFRDCYLTDGTLLNAMLAKLARTQGETEWGVRVLANGQPHVERMTGGREACDRLIECKPLWWPEHYTDLRIVSRAAAGEWEVTE